MGKPMPGWPQMNATFFGLAFLAALNPKLLGVDLLLTAGAEPGSGHYPGRSRAAPSRGTSGRSGS